MADKPSDKHHHVLTILGIGVRPAADGPPPGMPGMSASHQEGPSEDEGPDKISPERALYAGPDEVCGNCANWTPPNSCTKVDVVTDPHGRCYSHFTPKGGGQVMGEGGMPLMPPVMEHQG